MSKTAARLYLGHNVYLISGHGDITEDEFKNAYLRKIRECNAIDSQCAFIVTVSLIGEMSIEAAVRSGIPANRISIYAKNLYAGGAEFTNKYGCNVKYFDSDAELAHCAIMYSTHDIIWKRSGSNDTTNIESVLERRRQKRLKEQAPKQVSAIYAPKT